MRVTSFSSTIAIFVCFLSLNVLVSFSAIPEDRIDHVPFFNGSVSFEQYAGYINVDATNGRSLYYWFAESQNDPSNDPVVLWLNGGPGCSSLDGFFYEHGPFKFDRTKNIPYYNESLHRNPFSWNNVSNVIYLEAPAGVGFSYSNDKADYHTNDNKTAMDNYQFLVNFFNAYPEFAKNDFYISGESYAGIYVPTLAYLVHEKNQVSDNKINLKGILVGNGVTDEKYDATSFPQFAFNHALYSPNLYKTLQKHDCIKNPNTLTCELLETKIYAQLGNVNMYDIYKPCYDGPDFRKEHMYNPLQSAAFINKNNNFAALAEVPCINSAAATEYLNDPNVRRAIHAEPISKIGSWAICSNKVSYKKIYNSVLFAYKLLTKNYRVLFYSGDVDGSVPYYGSMEWLYDFEENAEPKVDWEDWKVEGQIAGYKTKFVTPFPITFTTVKGAGHMVPQFKPPQAYYMFSKFLKNEF